MQVTVLFFGVLKDMFAREKDVLDLPAGATVAAALDGLQPPLPAQFTVAAAINQTYAARSAVLQDGDELALLPPVSGGSGPLISPFVSLVREPIEAAPLLAALQQPEDGAVVSFDGIVRNHTRGRRTLYLVYEAYEEMALKQMQALVKQAATEMGIRQALLVHRLGKLAVGETSVLIAAASAHRAQAFAACRWLIDTLKQTVPIWKKEYFEDGAVWGHGEPFPAELFEKGKHHD